MKKNQECTEVSKAIASVKDESGADLAVPIFSDVGEHETRHSSAPPFTWAPGAKIVIEFKEAVCLTAVALCAVNCKAIAISQTVFFFGCKSLST